MKKLIALIIILITNVFFGQNFTDTKGELQVTNSGQVTYTLPIAMPPSIKNVAPVINLMYASGVRGGIAGQGWHISSISNISRIATRKDIDGFVDGVDFDTNDKLALDGQRLLLKTGTYWENGSTYETEYKSNSKIELKIESTALWPTTYFIVTGPDGSRTWYGSNGNGAFQNATSRTAAWYIVRFEDVHGNYITYNYATVVYNSIMNRYISNIMFSGNEGQGIAQTNKIVFLYEDAKRVERDYINGNPFYASKVLDKIEVYTGGDLFKRYDMTRSVDSEGYERVAQIQEFNGLGEAANPVVFEYNTTYTNTTKTEKTYYNNLELSDIDLSGDFDGDGRLDFVANNQLYKNLFNGSSGDTPIALPMQVRKGNIFAATTIDTATNKINQQQSIVFASETTNTITFRKYKLNGNTISFESERVVSDGNTGSVTNCTNYGPLNGPFNYQKESNLYYEGDFNGDGASEVLIISTINETQINGYNPSAGCIHFAITNSGVRYRLVDLDQNYSNGIYYGDSGYIVGSGDAINTIYIESPQDNVKNNLRYISDFNGDGRSDILLVTPNNKAYKILTFDFSNSWPNLVVIGAGTLDEFSDTKQLLLGDYNGDGKTDLMLPNSNGCDGCNGWVIFYSNPLSNGGEFFVKENQNITEYNPYYSGQTYQVWNNYYAMDINKDGKTDLVTVFREYYKPSWTINDHDTRWHVEGFTNNIGITTGNSFVQTYSSPYYWSDSPNIPIPLASNYRFQNSNTDLVIIRNHYNKIEYYQFDKNFNTDNRLKSVTESNGNIKRTVSYLPMEPSDFYSSQNVETYPNIEIIKNPERYLVSKLTANINGRIKHQNFKYHGYVSNFVYGDIGFKRTARSSWFVEGSNPAIWTIDQNDISLRGANTVTWTNTDGASVFNTIPSNLLSTKTNVFATYTDPATKVFNVLLTQQNSTDVLTGVRIEKNFTYDGTVSSPSYYGLQTGSETNYYYGTVLQGKSYELTPIIDYDNNPTGVGNAYYIGRPLKITTINNIYNSGGNDTRTSEEKYTYTGFNLTKTEKKGHNTDNIVEVMGYDPLGNLITKTVSMPTSVPAVASRTITDVYDPTKRFVIQKTDHQGYITLFDYNSLGQVKKSTDYMGVVNDLKYDSWGKLTESKISGASTTPKITTTIYDKNNDGGYYVLEKNTSGTNEMHTTQYDVLGRVIKTATKAFENDILLFTSIEYDDLGRKKWEWEPYFNTLGKKTEYVYDDLSRLIKVTAPTGKIQAISYPPGLTTRSDDDGRITTTTLDALGNKIQTTDEGGTVNFSYYANGKLKASGFDGNNVTIGIDGWGNKTSVNDPNAGTYTYSYDGFGQLITETTPKGSTNYEYDNFGKVKKKIVWGDGADYTIDYTYNSLGQLTNEISKNSVNAIIDTFDYGYDSLHRPTTTTENNNNLEHIKTITYDNHSRILSENNVTTEKLSLNFSSTFLTKYQYNAYNGIMDKITDANGTILWQLNSANEKMQTLIANFGNGVEVKNTYTSDSYLYIQSYKQGQTWILVNAYDFEPKRGNLRSRTDLVNSEYFTYDNLDRLWSWTNPITGALDYNAYDNKGRITVNNKVGDVRYNTNSNTGHYKKDNIKLNSEGQLYYGTLGGNQIVSYTMFKSPISINESNKGKIDFEYNSHFSRTKMLYDYGTIVPSTTKEQRKTKLYTDDGSSEVIYDKVANTIKIITFVGGDAYSASLYIDKTINRNTNVTTEKKYYLHRDYLGSILAITDEAGNAVEKRQFDAWGNLVKLINASGASVSVEGGLQFFDRGYTSHEHLQEVRLIHMNGRLYDPRLRSFLMPDNFVQQPENSQNYNRYAYCLNNPLKYTDPSGELLLGAAIIIGAAIAAATYTITALTTDIPFTVGGLVGATFIGAASAVVTFGIGSAASSMFTTFYSQAAFQAMAHGAFQGYMAAVQGGDFWNGFAAGALSSIAASAWSGGGTWQGIGGKFADSGAGMIAFGTVAGGAGASLTGGNFWQGAVTGLIVSGLNHAAHAMKQPKTTVAGIYGAGREGDSGNPDLKKLVEGKGGQMFSSSFGTNDDEIIAYLKAGFEKGNQLEIYGYSRGGAAAVRIANKLGAMHINVSQITLYDPARFNGGGSFNFDYPNVMNVTNYYQRNPVDGLLWWANNPFQGSPVSGSFQWPAIRTVNYTGNLSINHINITDYAIKHP